MTESTYSTIDLDSSENEAIQAREWKMERIGWLVTAGIILVALLGFLGPGPLSKRKKASSDGRLLVEYHAIPRYAAPEKLVLHFRPDMRDATVVRVNVSRSFTDEITLDSITPPPEGVEIQDNKLVYRFRLFNLGEKGLITYRYKNESFGPLRYEISLDGGPKIEVSQFVCP